jgi:DNA mismatch repair ATPase MutL
VLFLEVAPGLVDVNVHPKKLEVKFIDSNQVYQLIYSAVRGVLGEQKISLETHNTTAATSTHWNPSHAGSGSNSTGLPSNLSSGFFSSQDFGSTPSTSSFFAPAEELGGYQDSL